MIPYGFGFEPNDYAMLEIDFEALRRTCKALMKKVSRKMRHKATK